jgi:hypothetical protein
VKHRMLLIAITSFMLWVGLNAGQVYGESARSIRLEVGYPSIPGNANGKIVITETPLFQSQGSIISLDLTVSNLPQQVFQGNAWGLYIHTSVKGTQRVLVFNTGGNSETYHTEVPLQDLGVGEEIFTDPVTACVIVELDDGEFGLFGPVLPPSLPDPNVDPGRCVLIGTD